MTERFTMYGSTIKDNGEEITAWDCCSLLNEQHETIQRLEAQLSHLQYRFFEYRNRVGKE